jgi:hypothetical protein
MTSLDAIKILACFILAFNPNFDSSENRRSMGSILLIGFAGIGVLIGGVFSKVGFDTTEYFNIVTNIALTLTERLAVHLISLSNIINNYIEWLQHSLDSFFFTIERFIFRLSNLVGLSAQEPALSNLARINALEFYFSPRDINGVHPGPVASALLAQPLFLGIVFRIFIDSLCVAYLAKIIKDFNGGIIVFAFFPIYLNLISSDLLFFNILSPTGLTFILLIILASKIEYMKRS